MKTTLVEIKTLIKTKLESVVDSHADPMFQVFDYPNAEFKKYPVAVILDSGMTGEVLDSARVERTFHFTVNLYQEQTAAGKTGQLASEAMERASDKLIEAFDQDPYFGNEVEKVRVVEGTFDFKASAGTFNFATFKIDVVVIVPNY